MANLTIYSWLIVLIISSHGILMNEGRVLKPIKKHVHQQPLRNADNLQDSPIDGVPSASQLPVSENKATIPPQKTAENQGKGRSEPESIEDFRPTTPGNSPGVGHSFADQGLNARSKEMDSSPAVAQSTAAIGEDFRPTGPGHSPGGGHSKDSQIVEPNA